MPWRPVSKGGAGCGGEPSYGLGSCPIQPKRPRNRFYAVQSGRRLACEGEASESGSRRRGPPKSSLVGPRAPADRNGTCDGWGELVLGARGLVSSQSTALPIHEPIGMAT